MTDRSNKTYQDEKPGYGMGRFILGCGRDGSFGHVALFVQFVPEPGFCAVEWRVKHCKTASDARGRVEEAVGDYLGQYMAKHPEYGFRVAIMDVISDELRKNDYKRATNLAFRFALEDISLPVAQIFGL